MLWNEPNNKSHWDFEIDPEWKVFAGMLRVACEAIAAERPKLPKVLGGISPIDPGFIENLSAQGALKSVDVVIFMGVLYHLRHPLLALDMLHRHVARDLLVFQSMLRGDASQEPLDPDYPFWETGIFERPAYPKMFFVEERYSNDPTNWWIPNAACAAAMLRSSGFAILDQPEPEVFICRRRELSPLERELTALPF